MSSMISDAELELLEQTANDFGVGVVNLGRDESLSPSGSFTLSTTFELNGLTNGLQSVLWNPRQYGIWVKNNDLKISLLGEDGRIHTTTVQDVFNETGWHDVQVVLDAEAGKLEFWIDGAVVYSGLSEGVALTSTVFCDVTAGGLRSNWYKLDGQVASVTIVDEALEIDGSQSLYDRMITISGDFNSEDVLPPTENSEAEISGNSEGLIKEDSSLETSGSLTADDADAGENGFQAKSETGIYGQFSIDADGNWTYSAADTETLQALGDGDQVTETFTVQSIDGTAKEVTITIDGTDDAPAITGLDGGTVEEDGILTTAGKLIADDADAGESGFQAANISGAYGTLTVAADGSWTYVAVDSAEIQALGIGNTLSEAFSVQTLDGTLKDISITINGKNDSAEISGVSTGVVEEDGILTVDGKLNISDKDTNESVFNAETQTGIYGEFSIDADGNWNYVASDSEDLQALNDNDAFVENFVVHSLDGTEQVIQVSVKGADEQAAATMEIGTAGIPIDLATSRDYDLIFRTLSDAGIDVFLPLNIYQEIPEVKGLNFEADFFPPPFGSATNEIYDLARQYGIKIVFSADLMYPAGTEMPNADADPLLAVINMGARDIIHSVFNYDEPILNGLDPAYSQALYEHVKSIDSTLVVQQVHAPVGDEADPSAYLASVLEHAEWTDTVGFDVYPIYTQPGAQSPYSLGEIIDPVESLKDYVSWLDANLADKDHLMVLQAFEIADLYSTEMLATLSVEELAISRAPTELEMRAMLNAVSDVDTVFWFGASFQASQSDATWQSVLSTSEQMADGIPNTPMGELIDIDSSANLLAENAAEGTLTGIQLSAIDTDAIDAVNYTLDDDRFLIDEQGQILVAQGALFDFEIETSISFGATARSTDGSKETLDLTIQLSDVIDVITGTSNSEALLGGEGADDIDAQEGDDLINGLGGDDLISGGMGDDFIYGGFGNDDISGGWGVDVLVGESGDDKLRGDSGDDYIDGGIGDDIISGGDGKDQLLGDVGADTISGDLGDDTMLGGDGNDTFVFSFGDGNDYILDFVAGQDTLLFRDGISVEDLSISGASNYTQIDFGEDSIVLLGVTNAQWGDIDYQYG